MILQITYFDATTHKLLGFWKLVPGSRGSVAGAMRLLGPRPGPKADGVVIHIRTLGA